MSTWTSERAPTHSTAARLAFVAVLALSGCLDLGRAVPDLSRGGTETRVFRDPGGLRVAGPRGYCVDPENSEAANGTGFVLLGGCDVLAEARRGPRHYAILSATYAASDGPGSARDYADFFATAQGRALLSRADDPRTVTILDSHLAQGVLYLHVRDTSPNPGARLAADHWRAAFPLGGYGLMLSVHATQSAPIAAADGRAKIGDFVRAVQRAN